MRSRASASRDEKSLGQLLYRLVTTPPGAELLLSGVPRLSAGAAITVSQDIDLGGNKREAELWVGRRHYRIRPDSKEPNLPQLLRRKLLALQKAG